MMTFKDLKKLVELPSYKEQRVPTVKALEVSGVPVVAEKTLENHGSISVYQNGYVIYRAHKRVTVFSLRNCVHYKYDALEGAGHHIEEEEFDEYEWHIRLVLEGEDRIFMNYEIIQGKWMPSREDREYKEEILEGVDEAVSTLERMISEERVEELLSTLTDLQRKVVHIHLFHGLSFTEAAKHLGMTRQNLTGIYNAAIYKMVYCGCCRRNMTFERRVHGTVKETHYGVFICKRKKNTTPCAYHAVPEKMLMMVAMDQIHHLVSTMCEEEKLVKDMMRGSNLDSARSIKMKENSILFRIQEAEERRLHLYEDYKAEILDEDEYSQLKEHYIAEKQRLEHELQKQRQRALELEKRIKICDAQMERMRGILNQNEFDEELVHELIKRIYVGMDNSVEVEFKCSDPYQEVLAIMSEVQNE